LRKGEGDPFLDLARSVVARAEEALNAEGPEIEIAD
jgi:hypothetical protein